MFEYIEKLKVKPAQVRQRIAFGAAGGVTALVAVGWIAVTATSGAFALSDDSFAANPDMPTDFNQAFEGTKSSFDSLLGAVGAFQSGEQGAQIIVETESSTSLDEGEQTVIPF